MKKKSSFLSHEIVFLPKSVSRENELDSDYEEEKRKNVDNFKYYLDLAKQNQLSWDVLNNLMNDLCSSRTKSKRLNILLLKELKILSESKSKLENKVEKLEKMNKKISEIVDEKNPIMIKGAKFQENLSRAPKKSNVHEDTNKSDSTKTKRKKTSNEKNTELKLNEILSFIKTEDKEMELEDGFEEFEPPLLVCPLSLKDL